MKKYSPGNDVPLMKEFPVLFAKILMCVSLNSFISVQCVFNVMLRMDNRKNPDIGWLDLHPSSSLHCFLLDSALSWLLKNVASGARHGGSCL
jgi:hypothetical protein